MEELNNPLFIMSSPRSGTTLLERLINQNTNIFIPPETEFFFALSLFYKKKKNAKKRMLLSEFADFYGSRTQTRLLGIPNELLKQLMIKNAVDHKDQFVNIMNFLTEESNKSRWGEKTPHHLPHARSITRFFPNAKFVFVVRDGRAVVKSSVKHPLWYGNLYSYARRWKRDTNLIEIFMEELPSDQAYIIQYEKMVAAPVKTLENLIDHLGDGYELLENSAGYSPNRRYMNYYRQPWMRKSTMGIDARRIDGWKKEYSELELAMVEGMIGRELQALGYELENKKHAGANTLMLLNIVQLAYRRTKRRMSGFRVENTKW